MYNKPYNQTEFRSIMRPAMAAAVMALIGGESLQLESPNASKEERRLLAGTVRDVPEGMVSYGSSIIRIMANGFVRVVYAHMVDERCRELFGFGLTMEGDHVVLKRPESKKASASMGYSYYRDEQGRDMINGDYAYELNKAYMALLERPMPVHTSPEGRAFIFNNTAKIYTADLVVTAKWCGDEVVIENGHVRIEGSKEEE